VFVGFVVLDGVAASYFLTESRRRSGSARARLVVAGVSTAALAVAILLYLVGFIASMMAPSTDAASAAQWAGRLVAFGAAIGYVVAFLPPAVLRHQWQAGTSYRLGGQLLETADAVDPDQAWRLFAELACELTGAEAAVVRGEDAAVRAAVGMDDPPTLEPAQVRPLLDGPLPDVDLPPGQLGDPWASIAGRIGARFLTIVRIERGEAGRSAVLLLYSRSRSLFAEDDRDLLASLGTQAAVLAERAALAADIRATLMELQSASAAKSDFLASMSHELRTPLNAIIGFSELMRMEPPNEGRLTVPGEWVDHVASAGQHLLDLINDVLDLAKVEAGRLDLELEPFDLDAAVVEWVGGVRPLAERKRIRLRVEGEAGTVVADRGRLRQIVYNLLSNAIKFTNDGGEVRVELQRTTSELCLAVVDNGIGIAPEDHEAVFEEFRQVGHSRDRQPGTGLGLALTRRLTEAHSGTIALESARGVGSRFIIRLPQPEVPEAISESRLATVGVADPVGREILVIEDDPSAVRLLREFLEGAGWRVRAASDGETGLATARERAPDAVVLDVLLPGIDGWDVLRTLKGDPRTRDVPVLMLTVVDEREVGLALGAADYLVKPVDRAALLARLASYTFTTKVKHGDVRVLVVDDDPAAVEVVAGALEPEGFTVIRALGGREALQLARSEPPALVISDLVMPELDGFELVAQLKADPRTRDAPILVVTARDLSVEDKARLNGDILGIVEKGPRVRAGLAEWLARLAPQPPATEVPAP
jgi:signal transduction histidine kinase/DNA-binding response OmpR family regulator